MNDTETVMANALKQMGILQEQIDKDGSLIPGVNDKLRVNPACHALKIQFEIYSRMARLAKDKPNEAAPVDELAIFNRRNHD